MMNFEVRSYLLRFGIRYSILSKTWIGKPGHAPVFMEAGVGHPLIRTRSHSGSITLFFHYPAMEDDVIIRVIPAVRT